MAELVLFLIFAAVAFFIYKRYSGKAQVVASVQPGLDALRAGFMHSRSADETEPVCVVAYHYSGLKAEQVTVGVTNLRVLVVKGIRPLQAFPYDDAGEHLPSDQKKKQQRGFFDWRHLTFKDGSTGYAPIVKVPPFKGEEWRMYPTLGEYYPEQKASLREFSRRFYFQWFYD